MAGKRKKTPPHRRARPLPSARATAVERAVHEGVLVGPPVHPSALKGADKELLAEALRRAEDVRIAVEGAVLGYGRWVLAAIFRDDVRAVLEDRASNAVWAELVARAGGPTLRMGRRTLYDALNIAAYDRHITDESFRLLDSGRKALLLPLGDAAQMRRAAQHVVAMKLTQRATRSYVRALLESRGAARQVRMGPRRARSLIARVASPLADPVVRGKLRATVGTLKSAERAALQKQLTTVASAITELLEALAS
jgi:hypothetical protein